MHSRWYLIPQLCCTRARRLAGWSARWVAAAQHGQSHRATALESAPSKKRSIAAWVLTGGALKPTNYLQGGHACFTTGQLWAKRVVEASPEAYDAVVVHAGSWDATYTAFNASGLEDGRRAEVFTWRHGASAEGHYTALGQSYRAAQGQLRMPRWWFGLWTLQPQAASSALEVRPSLN